MSRSNAADLAQSFRLPSQSFTEGKAESAGDKVAKAKNNVHRRNNRRARATQFGDLVKHVDRLTAQLAKAVHQNKPERITAVSELLVRAKARAQELAAEMGKAWLADPAGSSVAIGDREASPVKGGSKVRIPAGASPGRRVTDDAAKAQAWGSLGRAMMRAEAQAMAVSYHPAVKAKPKAKGQSMASAMGTMQAEREATRQAAYRTEYKPSDAETVINRRFGMVPVTIKP